MGAPAEAGDAGVSPANDELGDAGVTPAGPGWTSQDSASRAVARGTRDAPPARMRVVIVAGLASLFAAAAQAAPPADAPPPAARAHEVDVDVTVVPEPCQAIAALVTRGRPEVALPAKLSLASCMADVRM